MKNTDFDSKRIARGYVNRPWLHKQVMEQYIKDNTLSKKLSHGLDVGCGAGLSTKALRLICDDVTGTDISPAMIEVCKEQYHGNSSYDFYVAKAEETEIPKEKYDIVTAAGMANWVDRDLFLRNMSHVLTEKGVLFIYDFWITDQMQGSEKYTDWYQNEYLKKFPKPPRNEDIWTQEDLTEDFRMGKQIVYDMPYKFIFEDFVEFMMIQSNVNAKIESGSMTESEVREWMKKSLQDIFADEAKTLIFSGYNWYIYKV